jgi:hypothetical protein
MTSQVVNGKGFEWVVAQSAAARLGIKLTSSDELVYAAACYQRLSDAKKAQLRKCAERSIEYIFEQESIPRDVSSRVSLMPDAAGKNGDVRDVVIDVGSRQVGISCKTNHEAFKHQRLSATIDFVKEWGLGAHCSTAYWDAIKPIFAELRSIRAKSQGNATWANLGDYQTKFYLPVLQAWKDEMLRISDATEPNAGKVAQGLCRYIIGRVDFWKVVARSKEVKLFAFNSNHSLATKKTKLPDRILGIDNFDGSQYSLSVRMNEGYQFNFRIHNASSKVEPSLKFDVQSQGLPPQVHQHDISL